MIDIKHSFDEARRAAKIADFRFHNLRYTAATRLADAGVNVMVIAAIISQGDIGTTKRYSLVMYEAKRETVEILAKTALGWQKSVKIKGKEKRQAGRLAVNDGNF